MHNADFWVINVVFTVAMCHSLLMQIAAMYLIGIVCGRFFVKKIVSSHLFD